MGAPEGGLKQCAKGRGQDRTSGGGACVSKARFPFVRVGRQAAGWRPFLLKSATVSGPLKPVRFLDYEEREIDGIVWKHY